MYRILLLLSLMWPDFLQTWVNEQALVFMNDLMQCSRISNKNTNLLKFYIGLDFEKATLGQECSDFSTWHWVAAWAMNGSYSKGETNLNLESRKPTLSPKIFFMIKFEKYCLNISQDLLNFLKNKKSQFKPIYGSRAQSSHQ